MFNRKIQISLVNDKKTPAQTDDPDYDRAAQYTFIATELVRSLAIAAVTYAAVTKTLDVAALITVSKFTKN